MPEITDSTQIEWTESAGELKATIVASSISASDLDSAALTISASNLASNSVTTVKIVDDAVTPAKASFVYNSDASMSVYIGANASVPAGSGWSINTTFSGNVPVSSVVTHNFGTTDYSVVVTPVAAVLTNVRWIPWIDKSSNSFTVYGTDVSTSNNRIGSFDYIITVNL